MFSEAGEAWVLAAMTRPGAEQITTVAAAGEYLSTHVPENGPVGDGGDVHAPTHGRRGPVQCFDCQESGHVIVNCPHFAHQHQCAKYGARNGFQLTLGGGISGGTPRGCQHLETSPPVQLR